MTILAQFILGCVTAFPLFSLSSLAQNNTWRSELTHSPAFALLPKDPSLEAAIVPTLGDFNADGNTDALLVFGSRGALVFSQGEGTWRHQLNGQAALLLALTKPCTERQLGDFNGDGRADLSLLPTCGRTQLTTAYADGRGGWTVSEVDLPNFVPISQALDLRWVVGDFNGDGRDDLALLGASTPIRIAFSEGNGRWRLYTSGDNPRFRTTLTPPNTNLWVGDFNGDGRADLLALNPTTDPKAPPLAFSDGKGGWVSINTNQRRQSFTQTSISYTLADINGDRRTDIVRLEKASHQSPILSAVFSHGDGRGHQVDTPLISLSPWIKNHVPEIVAGDINGDRRDDIILIPKIGKLTLLPIALSNGDGTWWVRKTTIPKNVPPSLASEATPLTGDFNGDSRTDIMLVPTLQNHHPGTIPILFSTEPQHLPDLR